MNDNYFHDDWHHLNKIFNLKICFCLSGINIFQSWFHLCLDILMFLVKAWLTNPCPAWAYRTIGYDFHQSFLIVWIFFLANTFDAEAFNSSSMQ